MKRNIDNGIGARCEDCAATRTGGFRKVAALYGTGVAIYLHTRSLRSSSDQCDKSSQTRESSRNPDTLIVHNTSETAITRNTMVGELSKYKTNCVTCKGIIKRVRNLLEEVRAIRRNEVYAICDHCKRTGVKCKRCEYILGKFKESKTEERELLFKQWLCKVKQLLETISKGNICHYKLYRETADAAELDNLLMELNSPMLAQRHLEIGPFPPMEFQDNLAQSKDMLQELITKLKYESGTNRYSSDDSLFMPASADCVCKYLMDRKIEQRKALQALNQEETEPSNVIRVPSKNMLASKPEQKDSILQGHRANDKEKSKKGSSTTLGSVKEKSTKARQRSFTTEESVKEKSTKARERSFTTEESVKEKSTKARQGSSNTEKSTTEQYTIPAIKKSETGVRSGVIRYRLSDRQFIEKGWTQLPSTKILRRMNVYKMLPARSDDWFTRHKNRGTMLYDSGEKLAEVERDGQGRWYYKNGMVALEYYDAEETFVRKRCVVYSHEACIYVKTSRSQTVLACFDSLGNGVVYDHQGNERLKYNQTEGELVDGKIGPPSIWKWHTLNDPPVLQKTFIDTYSKDRSTFKKPRDEDDHEKSQRNEANEAMLAVEFDNFVKAKADKLRQEFKPFQIRMKTIKINDYFSVRVIDQANVCLLFRDRALTLKLDLGVLLQSKEIIDTDSVELSCVGTPYDRRPARSKSVDRLQGILLAARGKQRECGHCNSPANLDKRFVS